MRPNETVCYKVQKAEDHPLARANGVVPLHRLVLYEAIGPGPHVCHWCGIKLSWSSDIERYDQLVVDHVDGNMHHNERDNLVPSCIPCNSRRGTRRPLTGGEFYIPYRGGLHRAKKVACAICGEKFVSLTSGLGFLYKKTCSAGCANKIKSVSNLGKPKTVKRIPAGALVLEYGGQRNRAEKRTCLACGIEFLARISRRATDGVVCSVSCRHELQRRRTRRLERLCEYCGGSFQVRASDLRRASPRRFCGRVCVAKWSYETGRSLPSKNRFVLGQGIETAVRPALASRESPYANI